MSATFLQQNFRESSDFLKAEGRSLAGAARELVSGIYGLATTRKAWIETAASLQGWFAKNKTQRLCDRLNDQIRYNFVRSLSKSDFDSSPTSEAAARDYSNYSREYTGGVFKLGRWLTSRPLTSITALIGSSLAISTFLTPFASFVPLMSFVLSKYGEQRTLRKLTQFEQEFKKTGLKTPKYFSVSEDGKLTFDGHQVIVEGNDLFFADKSGEKRLQIQSEFGLVNAYPVHHTKTPSYIYSEFDARSGTFTRSKEISAFGYEAMVQGHNPNVSGGLTMENISWIQKHFRNAADQDFIYLSSLTFPDQSLEDHISLLEKTREETVAFSFDGKDEYDIPAHEAIIQSLRQASKFNLSSFGNHVSMQDLKEFANQFPSQSSEQAKAMMIMMGKSIFKENMTLLQIAEISDNMGIHALNNVDRNGDFPMVFKEYLTRGISDWGDIFANEWQKESVRNRFTFEELREISQNYLSWGEKALNIAHEDTEKSLGFSEIRERARKEMTEVADHSTTSLPMGQMGDVRFIESQPAAGALKIA